MHPNQAKAARERYSAARGKSDRFDAFVLAELAAPTLTELDAFWPGALVFSDIDSRSPSPSWPATRAQPMPRAPRRRAAHPDGAIFAPLLRDRKTAACPATPIAELGDARGRYPTDAALAADAGMSPVALESGKRRAATFRRACDKRLRVAVATTSPRDPHAGACLAARALALLAGPGALRPALHGNFRRLQPAGG